VTLRANWATAVAAAGGTGGPDDVARVGAALLGRWREPHRHHHGEQHLADVLDAVHLLADETADVAVVLLAAWYHDAVYDGRPGEDEERSAQCAERELAGLGVPPQRVRAVAGLVRATVDHTGDPPAGVDGRDAAVLNDADLSVLAAVEPRYRRYADGVRAEYAHVPEAAFRQGRAAVLQRLLAAPHLFRTHHGRAHWEPAARRNLARELAELTDRTAP
jgi:predicted metal-dependent HD superfamily phosphohydrolase